MHLGSISTSLCDLPCGDSRFLGIEAGQKYNYRYSTKVYSPENWQGEESIETVTVYGHSQSGLKIWID